MENDRRQFITGAASVGALPAALVGGGAAAAVEAGMPSLPDIAAALREPFLDRERARRILAAEGLDALVVADGRNLYHATNFFPLLERMSVVGSSLAVVPRDPARPVALVIPAFTYYYIQSDEGLLPGVQPFVFAAPGPAGARIEYRLEGEPSLRERRRREALQAAGPLLPGLDGALAQALRGLGVARGRIGYDLPTAARALAAAAPEATAVAAEDTPRRIRLVRTAAELRMMALASAANVAAARATVAAARGLGSLRAVRQRFFAEAALRGNLGVFMVVDGVSSDAYDEPLRDGQSFLIDCVSQLRHFHGDYGRTVFIGEPTPRMRRCTQAMAATWAELQGRIRPGLRFSEVRELGATLLAKHGVGVPVGFNTHSVGLAHTDQPRTASDGSRADTVIEADMVLSIDCPLQETGSGGTAHLEDLVRITPQGAVPIHATDPVAYTV